MKIHLYDFIDYYLIRVFFIFIYLFVCCFYVLLVNTGISFMIVGERLQLGLW